MTAHPVPVAPSSSASTSPSSFFGGPWPFVVATGGEFVALYFWLTYFDAGSYVLATIVLWAGFLTERVVVLNWTAYFRGTLAAEFPESPHYDSFASMSPVQKLAKLLRITVTEIFVWVVAVLVFDTQIDYSWVAAFAVLIVGEQLQHSWELSLIASRPIGDYIPTMNALTITLLETVGGIIWIGLVRNQQPQLGGLFLLIGLSIEHVVQSRKIVSDLTAQFSQQAAAGAASARGTIAAPVASAGVVAGQA